MKFWICGTCGRLVFDRRNHRQPYLVEFNVECNAGDVEMKCSEIVELGMQCSIADALKPCPDYDKKSGDCLRRVQYEKQHDIDECFLRDYLWRHRLSEKKCSGLPYHPCGKCRFYSGPRVKKVGASLQDAGSMSVEAHPMSVEEATHPP